MRIYVQFTDSTETTIINVFACPQDVNTFQNQGEVDCTDERYQAFINPASTLAGAKSVRLTALAADFATASVANVTDSSGVTWSGGLQSALSIDGATRLAAAGGATTIDIFDAENIGHTLTIAEANAVSIAIGAAYQVVFAKYQGYKVAIAAVATVAEVQAVVWE